MANLTITAASVVVGANSTRDAGFAGEAITAGQAVYLSPTTKKWMLADNNSATAAARKAQGIALNGAPPPIKVAIMMLVAQWYGTREASVVGQAPAAMPFAVDALLHPYRVWMV